MANNPWDEVELDRHYSWHDADNQHMNMGMSNERSSGWVDSAHTGNSDYPFSSRGNWMVWMIDEFRIDLCNQLGWAMDNSLRVNRLWPAWYNVFSQWGHAGRVGIPTGPPGSPAQIGQQGGFPEFGEYAEFGGGPNTTLLSMLRIRGILPMVSWAWGGTVDNVWCFGNPGTGMGGTIPWFLIATGHAKVNAYLDEWMGLWGQWQLSLHPDTPYTSPSSLYAYNWKGYPAQDSMFIRMNYEMNGDGLPWSEGVRVGGTWYNLPTSSVWAATGHPRNNPSYFRNAWRYVVTYVQNAVTAWKNAYPQIKGNIYFIWCPTGSTVEDEAGASEIADYYPMPTATCLKPVDYHGFDAYNFLTCDGEPGAANSSIPDAAYGIPPYAFYRTPYFMMHNHYVNIIISIQNRWGSTVPPGELPTRPFIVGEYGIRRPLGWCPATNDADNRKRQDWLERSDYGIPGINENLRPIRSMGYFNLNKTESEGVSWWLGRSAMQGAYARMHSRYQRPFFGLP